MNKAILNIKYCLSFLMMIVHTFVLSQSINNKTESYTGKKFEIVIFTLDTTKYSGCFDSKNFIVPKKKCINECEKLLHGKFKKIYKAYTKNHAKILNDENILNYKLQIASYIDNNGDEILFISGAHSTLNKTSINYKEFFICHPMQLSNYCFECPNYRIKIEWWGVKFNCRTNKFYDFVAFDPS